MNNRPTAIGRRCDSINGILNWNNFDQFFTPEAIINRIIGNGSISRQMRLISVPEFEIYFYHIFYNHPQINIQRKSLTITILNNGTRAIVEEDHVLEAHYPIRTITSQGHLTFQIGWVDVIPMPGKANKYVEENDR